MFFQFADAFWLTLGIGGGSLWFGDCIYRRLTESSDLRESLGEIRPFHSEIYGSVENGCNEYGPVISSTRTREMDGNAESSISFRSTIIMEEEQCIVADK